MGASGARADAEILVLAEQLLRGMGLPRFVIDLGTSAYSLACCRRAELRGAQADRLRSLFGR